MRRLITALILIITFGGLFSLAGYFLYKHILGTGFVHGPPITNANIPSAFRNRTEEQTQDTISFAVIADKFKFDKQLNLFLASHPRYQLPEKMKVLEYAGCGRDDMSFRRQIYFDESPREIYRLTFDENSTIGFIDLVYSFSDSTWHCSNRNRLDIQTKQRILKRLNTEILQNLQ